MTSHKGTAHSNDNVVEGNYTSLDEAASARYNEIGDRTLLGKGMRDDVSGLERDHAAKITTTGEEIKAWLPSYRVRKGAETGFPMQDLKR